MFSLYNDLDNAIFGYLYCTFAMGLKVYIDESFFDRDSRFYPLKMQ